MDLILKLRLNVTGMTIAALGPFAFLTSMKGKSLRTLERGLG